MPQRQQVTFEEAQNDVLERIGQPADGATDPSLLAMVKGAINSSQKRLADEHWFIGQKSVTVSLLPGQRWVDLPEDCDGTRINEVQWSNGTYTEDLLPGDVDDLYGETYAYEIKETVGVVGLTIDSIGSAYTTATLTIDAPAGAGQTATADAVLAGSALTAATMTNAGQTDEDVPAVVIAGDGSGAAATAVLGPVLALYLGPSASVASSLVIRYQTDPHRLVNNADRLPFESEGIIGHAAATLAGRLGLPGAQMLVAESQDYLNRARGRQGSGGTFSMTPDVR